MIKLKTIVIEIRKRKIMSFMRIFAPRISGTPDESFSHPAEPWRICRNRPSRQSSGRREPPISRPRVRWNSARVRNSGKVLVAGT